MYSNVFETVGRKSTFVVAQQSGHLGSPLALSLVRLYIPEAAQLDNVGQLEPVRKLRKTVCRSGHQQKWVLELQTYTRLYKPLPNVISSLLFNPSASSVYDIYESFTRSYQYQITIN
jgi:hypothetical protein